MKTSPSFLNFGGNIYIFSPLSTLYTNHFLSTHHKHRIGRSTDEHIDRTIVKDLVSDEDAFAAQQEAKAQKKQRKLDERLRQRLVAEKKAAANKSNKKEAADDDDEGEMIAAFAKGSRGKGKTK